MPYIDGSFDKMSVLILYYGSISRITGTSERVLQVAMGLADQGASVTLSGTILDYSETINSRTKIHLINAPTTRKISSIISWIVDLFVIALLRHRYDVVQIENFPLFKSLMLYFLLRPLGRKFIVVFHDKFWERDPRGSVSGRLQLMLHRVLLSIFDASITPGLSVKRWFEKLHGKQLSGKIIVIPNGAPNFSIRDDIDSRTLRKNLRIAPDAFVVCFFGLMEFKPNYESAMYLYKVSSFISHKFEEFTGRKLIFLVAGKGSKALPKTECFFPLGFIKKLEELLSLPDIIVLPHSPCFSGPHVKTMYSFLSGKPVVATEDAVKDMPGVVEGKQFISFDINERVTLLNALKELYYEKELREMLVTNAYLYCKKFSWQYISSSHLRLYSRLFSLRKP